ncbi:unnamed protein product, partial [Prorocentrum cordatum]
ILDTATVRFEPLARGRPMPDRCRQDCFLFDPILVRELSEAIARAKVLADIAGEDIEVDAAEIWVVSDPSHPRFGEQVEPGILDDAARALLRETTGVVQLDANDASSEVHVSRVNSNDLVERKSRVGGGGGLRLLGTYRTAGDKRILQAKDAVGELEETKFDDFPFDDPRAAKEYLDGILETTAIRTEERQRPDYSGLGYMLAGSTEDRGRVAVPKFTKWVAEKRHQGAFALKESRLLREKRQADEKRRGKGPKGPKGGGKSGAADSGQNNGG